MTKNHCVISAVGDVLIDNEISGNPTDAAKILKDSDFVFANLEGAATDRGVPADKWAALRQKPSLLAEYKKMNVSIFTLANNHVLDFGQIGLLDTLENLAKNGFRYVGAGLNLGEALKPAIAQAQGLRVAFMGFASTLPLESPAKAGRPGIAPVRVRSTHYFDPGCEMEQPGTPPVSFTHASEEDVVQMRRSVRAAKKKADYLIVGSHWGMPYQESLLDYQTQLGHEFIDAGADLVIGNHPHRLQAVEAYKGGVVFHSLGNFLFRLPKGFEIPATKWNPWPPRLGAWSQSNDSVIVRATLSSNTQASLEIIPTVWHGDGYPRVADAASFKRILSHLTELSANLNVRFRVLGRRVFIL